MFYERSIGFGDIAGFSCRRFLKIPIKLFVKRRAGRNEFAKQAIGFLVSFFEAACGTCRNIVEIEMSFWHCGV